MQSKNFWNAECKPQYDSMMSIVNKVETYDEDLLETEGSGNPILSNIKNRIKGTEDTRKQYSLCSPCGALKIFVDDGMELVRA